MATCTSTAISPCCSTPIIPPLAGDNHSLLQVTGALGGTFADQNLPALDQQLAWIHLHLPENGTLSIADAEALFSGWIHQFEELEEPADRAPGANPSGDGVINMLKYVFDMDPTLHDRNGIPVPDLILHPVHGTPRLALVVQLNPNAVGIRLIPEATDDLTSGQWHGGPEHVEILSHTPDGMTIIDAAPNATQRFLRLRVEYQE
ncbi:MAG: hypothetical protein LAT83_12295 [Kiritimatiellae bacterium]|nr:hypothetical protein [Kiritimatiellia bacterium]